MHWLFSAIASKWIVSTDREARGFIPALFLTCILARPLLLFRRLFFCSIVIVFLCFSNSQACTIERTCSMVNVRYEKGHFKSLISANTHSTVLDDNNGATFTIEQANSQWNCQNISSSLCGLYASVVLKLFTSNSCKIALKYHHR